MSKDNIEDRALTAVAKYLESKGWKPLVIGFQRIQGPVARGMSHELVVRFTGGKKRAGKPAEEGTKAQ